ncbi:uncharacterized protein LOC106140796 [Amyelois transitella]|uniref:uncharacterized protein LOC106140796 n=1 Tax=Amyelois transitella TaxID=680683 RepID=UPI00298F6EAB|nr:uncharacterized protein LOC106140796 [Amyelois transitella]
MGGTAIQPVSQIKLLGVTIDSKLTFNAHVANACKKATGIYRQLAKAAKTNWGLNPEIVRVIYNAAVEPVVLYAASVWGAAAEKISVRKQLDAVQRGFAQKICRAYRTVSLNSALVLAGLLPLDLRIREAASLYEIKRGARLPELGDWEIERTASALDAPHPAERIDLGFTGLADRQQVEANINFDVRIYTDGSKIDGGVGAAISIWRGEAETRSVKFCLSSYCTVYQAELLAICEATRRVIKYNASTFGVYSDSMAALQTVTSPVSLHPLAVKTRENLKTITRQNKSIKLFWIKAHAGLEGNERADQLAKEAAVNTKRKADYDLCPVSCVKGILRKRSLGVWDDRYRLGETAGTTKIFFPVASDAYKVVRQITLSGPITQILTGHGGFADYLCKFKCRNSPECECDPGVNETVPHLLTDCPIFGRQRADLEYKIGCKIILDNLAGIIRNKNRKDFLKFMKYIVTVVNKKNSSKINCDVRRID